MDVDLETNKAYLPTVEFEEQKPGATGRPAAKPGTFMIVVVTAPLKGATRVSCINTRFRQLSARPHCWSKSPLQNQLPMPSLAELFLESLPFAIQHHLVEGVGQRLAAGVGARLIGAGLDSGLRQL
jgi:hypothetical protein